MRTVDLERTIRAPRVEVFDWLTDISNYRRVPIIRAVRRIRPGDVAEHGTGSVRRIASPPLRLTEQVVDYSPPHRVRYRITDSFPPLRHSQGVVSFDPVAGGTRVRWSARFEVVAPFGGGLLTMLLQPILAAGIRQVLDTAETELRHRQAAAAR
ncbi:SRPBCC family protein [Nocardia sp. NPDC052254]|uniref:SRPBCC family protein n=1 Tax=Nocardia sp. NPDC052254 TaxID=3155681 RepID=UPI00342F5014